MTLDEHLEQLEARERELLCTLQDMPADRQAVLMLKEVQKQITACRRHQLRMAGQIRLWTVDDILNLPDDVAAEWDARPRPARREGQIDFSALRVEGMEGVRFLTFRQLKEMADQDGFNWQETGF